jgi:prolyl-tRNA synthetase
VMTGRKTERERFSGATTTWTLEAMMRDGKALQMGTSHELGQNFARVFNTTYLDAAGQETFVWQTSWGVSTRLMGALVMAHGDDAGLRLPPLLAPLQVVVLVVRADEGAGVRSAALARELGDAGWRVHLDDRVETSFGRRVVDWELKGVPVRVEVGPRELAAGEVVLARRHDGVKERVAVTALVDRVRAALDAAQSALLAEAAERQGAATSSAGSLDEAEVATQQGFAVVPARLVGGDGETRLNAAGVSVRLLRRRDGGLPVAGDEPDDELEAVVARAY